MPASCPRESSGHLGRPPPQVGSGNTEADRGPVGDPVHHRDPPTLQGSQSTHPPASGPRAFPSQLGVFAYNTGAPLSLAMCTHESPNRGRLKGVMVTGCSHPEPTQVTPGDPAGMLPLKAKKGTCSAVT